MTDRSHVCVLIPAFQAAATVGAVVRGAMEHVDRVLVVNDGSWDGTGDVARAAGADVVDHPINLGKGQTLKTGMRYAHRLGFTHAISLDADGRHDPADLPLILEQSAANPDALVVGQRPLHELGASARAARWVCSVSIRIIGGLGGLDPLCGLRCYPLARVRAISTRGERYEFEAEVIIRALWAGIPVVPHPVAVARPDRAASHFRLLADSSRIAGLLGLMFLPGLIPALRRRPLEIPEPAIREGEGDP